MILLADKTFGDEFKLLSRSDPYGCRIISLLNTYDASLPFVDYWVQYVDDKPVSLLARLDATFVLRMTEKSDTEEISAFLNALGAASVICDAKYRLDIGLKRFEGPLLTYDNAIEYKAPSNLVVPSAKEVYSVISRCGGDSLSVPSYENFMLDIGNKLSKNAVRMFAIKEETIVSCAMTLAESEDSAIIGAVATLPEYRHRGYGSTLVKHLVDVLSAEWKVVFLHRSQSENIQFYDKLGFRQWGRWCEYRKER